MPESEGLRRNGHGDQDAGLPEAECLPDVRMEEGWRVSIRCLVGHAWSYGYRLLTRSIDPSAVALGHGECLRCGKYVEFDLFQDDLDEITRAA